MTISERIAHRLRVAKTHNAASTRAVLASKYATIGTFFANGITQRRVEEYIESRLASGIMASTINYELSLIHAILDPRDNVKIKRLRDRHDRQRVYLTQEEIAAILSELQEDMRNTALAYLYTGCRLMELMNVSHEDLTVNPGFLRVKNQKTMQTSHDHYRMVPLREELYGLIPLPQTVTPASFRGHLERAAKRAGVGIRVTPKTLRSTYASHLAQAGVPIETIAVLLGHSDTKITMKHYSHLCPRNLTEAVAHLGRWNA